MTQTRTFGETLSVPSPHHTLGCHNLLGGTETLNVGKYFDYEGHFDEWGLGDAVKKLVGRLEKRVRDKKKKEK